MNEIFLRGSPEGWIESAGGSFHLSLAPDQAYFGARALISFIPIFPRQLLPESMKDQLS